MKKIFSIFFFFFLFYCTSANAEEIKNFEVEININEDGALGVAEKIIYDFGDEEKHGIYRDIPYRYKARGGNYELRLSEIIITDEEGEAYNFVVSKSGNNKRIKIGDQNKTISGIHVYKINYNVKRAINFFADHDELYWNATGNDWEVPIRQGKTTVFFPKVLDSNELKTDCFSGILGSNMECVSTRYVYSGKDQVNSVVFISDILQSGEGMTFALSIPKGFIREPSFLANVLEVIRDNWIILLPITIFAYLFWLWHRRGRDPEGRKTIVAQFDSPDSLNSAEVGTIIDEKADKKDISSMLIELAVRGYLKIIRIEGKGMLKKDDYELSRIKPGDKLENNFERELMNALFKNKKEKVKLSELKNKFYTDLEKITKEIYETVTRKGYFVKNPKNVRVKYFVMGIIVIFLSFFMAPFFGAIGIVSMIVSGVIVIIFSFLMPQRTKKGVLAREHILGLRDYLRVAEKDRIKFHNAPQKDPKHFEKLLPFAMVLGVEEEWAKQFEDIYVREPSWYQGGASKGFNSLILANNLHSFGKQANASLSSYPSQAASGGSSFSGGGFSGGGFGGGGGGSW